MARGENEDFTKQHGRFKELTTEEAREIGRKGGSSKRCSMKLVKEIAEELSGDDVTDNNGNKLIRAEAIIKKILIGATKGDKNMIKYWLDILQYGEPKYFDLTSGGAPLPNIEITGKEGGQRIARSEKDIEI